MTGASISLLDFLDAPIVVGDPDGRVVYMNSAFEKTCRVSGACSDSQFLAGLFDGGGREAVLRAVSVVCSTGESVRFRLRLDEAGFVALASPLKSDQASVGVVILLTEEPSSGPRVLALHRGVQTQLDEISRGLGELSDATGGLRAGNYIRALEDSLRALGELRKYADEIQMILDGSQ
jgi:nitrogen-specific signal transduction histidine kinase